MPERYVFEKLINAPQPPDIEDAGCVTQLVHDTAKKGNPEALKRLLEAGADPNARDDNGFTPLHLVTDVAKAKILLEAGADPRLMHYNGYTPLHMAVERWPVHDPNNDLLLFYLEHLPIEALLQKTYHRQDSVLHLAARYGMNDTGLMQKMIDLGVAVNALDLNSQTPLQMACEKGQAELARVLIRNGADVNKAPDNVTYLAFAAYACSADIIGQLIDAGVNVDLLSWRGKKTSLAIAAGRSDRDDNIEVIECLLKAGANPSHRCGEDKTPLHEVGFESAARILPLLIKAGADVNAQDCFGRTPMHALISDVQKKRAGPVRDDEEKILINGIRLLLDAGANPDLKDADGKRPYEYAYTFSLTQTIDFLQDVTQRKSRKDAAHGPRPGS